MKRYRRLADHSELLFRLTRVDPARRMNRWYAVSVQPGLFDRWAVITAWGNRRTTYQRLRLIPAASQEQAQSLAEKIIRRKVKKGYALRE